MPVQWTVDGLETTADAGKVVVYWRATLVEGAHSVTSYGSVVCEGLNITPDTTEEQVTQKIKETLNGSSKIDENGNFIPPMPGEETAVTDGIEASLHDQLAASVHPTVHSIDLPWAHPAPAPAPPPASNKKSGAK